MKVITVLGNKGMEKIECPNCGKEIDALETNEKGVYILKDGCNDPTKDVLECNCPECGEEIEYEDLVRLGVVE